MVLFFPKLRHLLNQQTYGRCQKKHEKNCSMFAACVVFPSHKGGSQKEWVHLSPRLTATESYQAFHHLILFTHRQAMFLAQLPKLLTKVTQWLQKQNIQKCGGELDVLFGGEKTNLRCNRISVENPENPLRSTLSGTSPNRTLSLKTLRDTPGWLPLFVRSNDGFAGLFSCEAFKSGSIHCLRHGVWAVKADPL